MNSVDQVREKIGQLENSLKNQNPNISGLLKEILVSLKADQNIVTIFSPEEIGILVSGLKRQTQVVISSTKSKSSSIAKKGASLSIGTDL